MPRDWLSAARLRHPMPTNHRPEQAGGQCDGFTEFRNISDAELGIIMIPLRGRGILGGSNAAVLARIAIPRWCA
jgi:hypothetical protein